MLKRKIKYVLMPILIIITLLLIDQYYIEHIYIPSLTLLYHYQEGVVFYSSSEDGTISYADDSDDFSVDIYTNGVYVVKTFRKGTEKVKSYNVNKLSNTKFLEIKNSFSDYHFEELPDFIMNGYLDGKGYELILYSDGVETKSVSGFQLTTDDINLFNELQQENYGDTLDAEVSFVKIKNKILQYCTKKKDQKIFWSYFFSLNATSDFEH